MAVVVQPFDFASDGFTVEHLNVGDERDFGAALRGLLDEGFVSDGSDTETAGESAPPTPAQKRGK